MASEDRKTKQTFCSEYQLYCGLDRRKTGGPNVNLHPDDWERIAVLQFTNTSSNGQTGIPPA